MKSTLPIMATVLALQLAGCSQDRPAPSGPETLPVTPEDTTLMATLSPQLDERRIQWIAELAEIASSGIGRRDTTWKVFHGCWDWHSAVHSHWALIRYARATGDRRYDSQVEESLLRKGGIEAEAELLRKHPRFEMPYGRAWFLRLVIDYELHFHDRALRLLGNEVLASMLAYYHDAEGQPARAHPRDLEYANASWAFLQMLAYARHIQATETSARLVEQITHSFGTAPAAGLDFASDTSPDAGFFSRFGNWITLFAAARGADTLASALPALTAADGFDLEPVGELHSDHHLGMNPSRAWALATLARETGDERYRTAWAAHLTAMKVAHDRQAGDYRAYDHWVPSFCIYALTEPLRPAEDRGAR